MQSLGAARSCGSVRGALSRHIFVVGVCLRQSPRWLCLAFAVNARQRQSHRGAGCFRIGQPFRVPLYHRAAALSRGQCAAEFFQDLREIFPAEWLLCIFPGCPVRERVYLSRGGRRMLQSFASCFRAVSSEEIHGKHFTHCMWTYSLRAQTSAFASSLQPRPRCLPREVPLTPSAFE